MVVDVHHHMRPEGTHLLWIRETTLLDQALDYLA